jgi:hypothetical protein
MTARFWPGSWSPGGRDTPTCGSRSSRVSARRPGCNPRVYLQITRFLEADRVYEPYGIEGSALGLGDAVATPHAAGLLAARGCLRRRLSSSARSRRSQRSLTSAAPGKKTPPWRTGLRLVVTQEVFGIASAWLRSQLSTSRGERTRTTSSVGKRLNSSGHSRRRRKCARMAYRTSDSRPQKANRHV